MRRAVVIAVTFVLLAAACGSSDDSESGPSETSSASLDQASETSEESPSVSDDVDNGTGDDGVSEESPAVSDDVDSETEDDGVSEESRSVSDDVDGETGGDGENDAAPTPTAGDTDAPTAPVVDPAPEPMESPYADHPLWFSTTLPGEAALVDTVTGAKSVVGDSGSEHYWPNWSPDAASVVTVNISTAALEAGNSLSIGPADFQGPWNEYQFPRDLWPEDAEFFMINLPRWSPDGRIYLLGTGGLASGDRFTDLVIFDTQNEEFTLFDLGDFLVNQRPTVSPDATEVVMTGFIQSRIYDVATETLGPPVDDLPTSAVVTDWSPDGLSWVYSIVTDGGSEIWISDVGGANPVQITNSPTVLKGRATYSPDGSRIAFSSNVDAEREGAPSFHVWIMNADGSNPQPLTTGLFVNWSW